MVILGRRTWTVHSIASRKQLHLVQSGLPGRTSLLARGTICPPLITSRPENRHTQSDAKDARTLQFCPNGHVESPPRGWNLA